MRTMVVAAAVMLWAVLLTGIGYVFADGIERLFGKIKSVEHVVIGALVVAAIVGLAIHFDRRRGAHVTWHIITLVFDI
ncbi:membrane protein DedA with SNARE-associated domain [Sphingomonas sp. UYAg733]